MYLAKVYVNFRLQLYVMAPLSHPIGDPSDVAASTGLSLRHLLPEGHRGSVRQTTEGDPGQEFCQLFRLLREVGAGRARQPLVQRDRGEQEVM